MVTMLFRISLSLDFMMAEEKKTHEHKLKDIFGEKNTLISK
jgi:hypothetical protein